MSFGQRLATSSIMLLGRLVRVIPRSVSSGKDGRNVRSASVKSAYPRSNLRSVGLYSELCHLSRYLSIVFRLLVGLDWANQFRSIMYNRPLG